MTLYLALLVVLQVCSPQLMVVAKPPCQMHGHLVESALHHLQDLVRPVTLKQSEPFFTCFIIYSSPVSPFILPAPPFTFQAPPFHQTLDLPFDPRSSAHLSL